MTTKPKKRPAPRKSPGVRTGWPTALQIPFELLDRLDGRVDLENKKLKAAKIAMKATRSSVILTALHHYLDEKEAVKDESTA